MDRINAVFNKSSPSLLSAPEDDLPEVAVAGRSNAGKSSVLNQITGNKSLARTSKTPGRTRLINFFDTDIGGRIVDLPGYGYAKAAKTLQREWQHHLEDYLAARRNLVAVVLVMDIRHPFEPFDTQMVAWARAAQMPMRVLLNKADKLRHGARINALRAARRVVPEALIAVQLFSAQTGLGRQELIDALTTWLTPMEDATAE